MAEKSLRLKSSLMDSMDLEALGCSQQNVVISSLSLISAHVLMKENYTSY